MATWTPQAGVGRSATSTQAASGESAPTLATEGMNLDSVGGFDLTVEADAGQTITASGGKLLAYRYFPRFAAWYRAPEFDVTIPVEDVGLRRVAFPGWTVANPHGRVAHLVSASAPITVSGGGLTVAYSATSLHGDPI
jgi:hypothetical protein